MRIFGVDISRAKTLNTVPDHRGWHRILEPFAGAWQRNVDERYSDLLAYPTLFACISRIAQDIAKLPFKLVINVNGIWKPADENSAFWMPLRKPNYYQTAQQFRESWALSKLRQGNAYLLKERDGRGMVKSLFPLDPHRVKPMVSDLGQVFYQIHNQNGWNLPTLPEIAATENGDIVIPAREIIHDRANTYHHPLIGIPPLAAAYYPAVKNLRILRSAAEFFANRATPSGILTAPAGMSEDDAARLKSFWDQNFTGEKAGEVAVVGADMKFTAFAMNAVDSQLVEQMKYSDEQICQPFGLKPYKIGIGVPPSGWKSDDVNVEYYGDALSPMIESMENLLDEGLAVNRGMGIELDTSPLWRMDEGKMAEVETKLVSGKVKTPDEARRRFNLETTGGGDTLWGQHQDYPLGVLAARDDLSPVAPEPEPAPDTDPDVTNEARLLLWQEPPERMIEKCLT